eukprot:Gb_01035 [translate_table: standard]
MGNVCKSACMDFLCFLFGPAPTTTQSLSDYIKEEINKLQGTNVDVTQLTPLVEFIGNQLSRIKAALPSPATASTSRSRMAGYVKDMTKPESVHSGIVFASKIIGRISEEVEELENTGIIEEMGRVAVSAVKVIGQSRHWALLGLSMVASVLEGIETVSSNVSECVELLERMVELAKTLQTLESALSHEAHREPLNRAVETIVEGATFCCVYIAKGKASRFLSARTVETQLEKTRKSIEQITPFLTLRAVADIAKGISHREKESPQKLLDIVPVGIDDRVETVKELLEMERSKSAVAVILHGYGGVGKSIMAASLQKDMIFDLEGGNIELKNDFEGRQKLGEVLKSKSCLLFIDNIVDKEYMKKLLPRNLSVGENKLRMLVTSRDINVRQEINIHCKEHLVEPLSEQTSAELLRKTILQGEREETIKFHINEKEKMISDIAKACHGVPLLLDIYGKYLRYETSDAAYKDTLHSLVHGNIRDFANDKDLSEQLLYVYDKMGEDRQESFLDICTYFYGWQWDIVSSIVGEGILNNLVARALVKKDVKSDEVAVHDVLRLMGSKKAKGTQMQSTAEFSEALENRQDVSSVKGIRLQSPIKLESRYINAMHNSLRVLFLENGKMIDGDQCNNKFHNLLFLHVGDVNMFPFKDASQLPKLKVFHNESEHGMDLARLPQTLKQIKLTVPPAYETSAVLPIRWTNMSSLRNLQKFELRTSKLVEFPEAFVLPAFIEELDISKCKELPEGFAGLTSMRKLKLEGCTELTALPEELGSFRSLMSLSMNGCIKLTALPKTFGGLTSLKDLSLTQCKSLEGLPEDFSKLSSLEFLKIDGCESLKTLSELSSSLRFLNLDGCFQLASLPEGFGSLRKLELLNLSGLIESLPEDFGNLCNLKELFLKTCALSKINGLGRLHSLEKLEIWHCERLSELPTDLEQLSCLKRMVVSYCSGLKELLEGFHQLPLRELHLLKCSSLVSLPKRFGELRCLEWLSLQSCLSLLSLPDGFGNLTSLKHLDLESCCNLRTLPNGFGNLKSLRSLDLTSTKLESLPGGFENLSCLNVLVLHDCRILEGEAMDRLVTVESLCSLQILRSNKLEERWEEMQKEEKEYPLVVRTSKEGHIIEKMVLFEKYQSAAGQYNQVQRMRGVLQPALERLLPAFMMIVYIDVDYNDDDDNHNNALQIPELLSDGSRASIDLRTRFLFRKTFYRDECTALVIADVIKYDKGCKRLGEFNNISVDFLKETGATIFYEFREFVKTVESSSIIEDEKNQFQKFRDILEKNGIYHFMDSQGKKVNVADLEGSVIALFICNPENMLYNYGETCNNLQAYCFDFKGVWIPSRRSDDFGASINNVHEKRMSVLTLLDPVLLGSFSKNSDKVIVFNKEGSISCRDASMWMMIWGPKFYPFTLKRLNELLSRESLNMERKSSFEFLIGERISFLDSSGAKVRKESLRGKVVMLYGGYSDTDFNSKLISVYEKLKYRMGLHNFEIVFVGIYKTLLLYEAFPHNIPCLSLSVYGMTTFWYRWEPHCRSELGINLSEYSAQIRNFGRLVKHVMNPEHGESGWVVVFDGNGEVVTLRGKEVVELLGKGDGNGAEEMVREAMIESIKNGNCSKIKIRIGDQEEAEVTETVHRLPKRIRPKANSRAMEQNKNKIRR